MMNKIRRNVSGLFIFDKFEDDEKRKPTCFEDCNELTQAKWLDSQDIESLKSVAIVLANALRRVCDQFDIKSES